MHVCEGTSNPRLFPAATRFTASPSRPLRDLAEVAPGSHSYGVGVMFINDEATLVVKQPVQHMRRLVRRRGDELGVKRRKLIG